ncbi:MAG: exodeoxyribonuclease VII small subunit [Gammaproteobacteria bacterium]
MAKRAVKTPDFEGQLKELESIVENMEKGDLSLDESLKQFEQGIKLTRTCQQALKTAEQKVEILMHKDADDELQPFDDQAE